MPAMRRPPKSTCWRQVLQPNAIHNPMYSMNRTSLADENEGSALHWSGHDRYILLRHGPQ